MQLSRDLRERDVIAIVPIDPVQARGSARLVVGLRVDHETQAGVDGPGGSIAVLAASAHCEAKVR